MSQPQMSSVQLQSVHHIAIICSNYEVSKMFYTEVLGCTIVKETYRAERESYKLPQIDLIVCVDFSKSPNNMSYNANIGTDAINIITLSVNSIFPNAKFLEHHKSIFSDKFCVNCIEYCEGIVPYVV